MQSRIVRAVRRRTLLSDSVRNWLINMLLRKRGDADLNFACIPQDLIGREIIVKGVFERDILHAIFDDVLRSHAVAFSSGIAIDVGANIGNHTCFFAPYFRNVVAFEPNPTAYHLLRANLRINRIRNATIEAVGLSDRSTELPFSENTSGNLGNSRFTSGIDASDETVEQLPVRVGDDFFASLTPDEKVALVKVDVENHELPVLRGLRKTLSTHHPIVLFESYRADGSAGGKEIFAFLRSIGYRYFYAVERRANLFRPQIPLIVRMIARLAQGADLWINEISEPENRFYALIMATKESL